MRGTGGQQPRGAQRSGSGCCSPPGEAARRRRGAERLLGIGDMDLSKLTLKSQAALEGAREQAVARNHQAIEPEHVLFALLSDPEGVVYPLLHHIGVTP